MLKSHAHMHGSRKCTNNSHMLQAGRRCHGWVWTEESKKKKSDRRKRELCRVPCQPLTYATIHLCHRTVMTLSTESLAEALRVKLSTYSQLRSLNAPLFLLIYLRVSTCPVCLCLSVCVCLPHCLDALLFLSVSLFTFVLLVCLCLHCSVSVCLLFVFCLPKFKFISPSSQIVQTYNEVETTSQLFDLHKEHKIFFFYSISNLLFSFWKTVQLNFFLMVCQ